MDKFLHLEIESGVKIVISFFLVKWSEREGGGGRKSAIKWQNALIFIGSSDHWRFL